MYQLSGIQAIGQSKTNIIRPQGPALSTEPSFSNILNASAFNDSKAWPGSEIYPPNPAQGNFYMTFPPGFPKDLSDKLKTMFSNDPSTHTNDWSGFKTMYMAFFYPGNGGAAWNSSWHGRLSLEIKANEGLIDSLDPQYRAAAREMNRMLKSLIG